VKQGGKHGSNAKPPTGAKDDHRVKMCRNERLDTFKEWKMEKEKPSPRGTLNGKAKRNMVKGGK